MTHPSVIRGRAAAALCIAAVTVGHTAAAQIDACALLTGDEVARVLGVPAAGMEDPYTGFDAACIWENAAAGGGLDELAIEVGQLDAASIQDEFASFRESMTFKNEVEGIGDAAFLAQYSLDGASLVIRARTYLIFVNTTRSGQEEALKGLGASVLARLE